MRTYHPNRIHVGNPAVLVLPSVVLCHQVYERLCAANVNVAFYKEYSGHQWFAASSTACGASDTTSTLQRK